MNRETITATIQKAAPELRAAGIEALYLFGSQARGDAKAESDIDLAFHVSDAADRRFSLLDQGRLQMRLQEIFGGKVDFIELHGMRPRMRQRVEQEMIKLL